MEENPNVTIEVEALDEEAYKTKFKAYSMEGMPDVVSIWGQPAFLDEVLDAGVLAELNQDDYKDYGFISGSLDGFMKDGKLYGLPRNTDVAGFYYNQKMFEDNGWEVPTIYDEFLTLAGEIKDKDIVPLAMDGGDGWPMAVHLSDILFKLTGSDYSDVVSNAISTGDFSDENLKKATELLKESADAGTFPDDQLSGIHSGRTGRGGSHGWMRYLQDHFPDHHTNAQVFYRNRCDHDFPEQLE